MGPNIDLANDDEYFAITEGMAVASNFMEEKGSRTLLIINLGLENGDDAILAGSVSEQDIERIEGLLEQLKERAMIEAEESPEDAKMLHLEDS